ncbi:MAG: aconitase X catalytic domain-containing protein [Anaerolineae bacterium]|nr:aconitase X catalytic domain-containing protein [Anaerolineae bacterium]
MRLTNEEQAMLDGGQGQATRKAMQILVALGRIYGADRMLPVRSVQIAGVSYDNLGDAGLEWLSKMADGGGRACVTATLNPAGMDIENWQKLGIPAEFAEKQKRVIDAFVRMGVTPTCTCTPYLAGNKPSLGDILAWAESSAVCYANSVIGARTNREGGPSALAAALTGCTPEYGMHLDPNRQPGVTVKVQASLVDTADFGALGKAIGEKLETLGHKAIPFITGIEAASMEQLKSFCASIATYGGLAMFHMQGITPEACDFGPPAGDHLLITSDDLERARRSLCDALPHEVDFVSLGCPHLSIHEVARVAGLLSGKRVTKEFWITTSRPVKATADQLGYTAIIEASGAKFAVDTCCVVAPICGRFKAMATDSAKACYYAYSKNKFRTRLLDFDRVIEEALEDET